MKTINFYCDECEKELTGECIEIGAHDDTGLKFKNTLAHRKRGELISLENYQTLHFCSKEHFVKFFFEIDSDI